MMMKNWKSCGFNLELCGYAKAGGDKLRGMLDDQLTEVLVGEALPSADWENIAPGFRHLRAESPALNPGILTKNK